MVEWLAGNRIRGTTAERPALGLQSPSVGGWVELARTTLGSTGNNIDVSSLPDKRYYMFLTHAPTDSSGYVLDRYRLNADTGSNYSYSASLNGAVDGTSNNTSQSEGILFSDGASIHQSGEIFTMGYIANLSGKEKLLIGHTVHNEATGAGTVPDRGESVGKHAQTSNPVTSVNCVNTNTSGFASGSEMVVLGWDPDDTHTTNFWEELASVDGDGTGTGLDSGTFTAKKYLWIQSYTEYGSGAHISPQLQVGNGTIDTGANYAVKHNSNGSEYGWTGTSAMGYGYAGGADNKPVFTNTFIINKAGQEKLSINHAIEAETAGAGTAPTKIEDVGKWANTSDQINRVQWGNNTGNISSKSTMRVWGSD